MSAVDNVIETFLVLYGDPKTSNPDMYIDLYRKSIAGIDGRVLAKATERVIARCVFWPKPAELIDEANRVAAQMFPARTDWDAEEAERRKGWSFADIEKWNAKRGERSAEHEEMMAQWRAFMHGVGKPVRFDDKWNWIREDANDKL